MFLAWDGWRSSEEAGDFWAGHGPDIQAGDRLAEMMVGCASKEIGGLQEKDIIAHELTAAAALLFGQTDG